MTETNDAQEVRTPDALNGIVSYWIRLIQISAYKQFESGTRGFGSSPRYYGLLKIVEHNPGLPQSRLAEAIGLDRSSLVPILDTLEKEGTIERRRAESDKRLRCTFITKKGAKTLTELDKLVAVHEAQMIAGLSEKERESLLRLLRKVAKGMGL